VGVVEVERGEVAREGGAGDCWQAETTVRESKQELAQSVRVRRGSSSSSPSPSWSADSSPATALSAQPGGVSLQQVAQSVLCPAAPAVPGLATLSIARPPLSSAFPLEQAHVPAAQRALASAKRARACRAAKGPVAEGLDRMESEASKKREPRRAASSSPSSTLRRCAACVARRLSLAATLPARVQHTAFCHCSSPRSV